MSEAADPDLARRILADAGATEIEVREWKPGHYVVSAHGFGCGVTDENDRHADTPQEVAAILVRGRSREALPPLADETVPFPVEIVSEPVQDAPLDAEFFEPVEALTEGDDPLLEFGGEMAEHEAEAETPTGQDRFIGLDDLDRRRSLRIGDVVRASIAKQAAIWAEAGATETEYYDLLNQVMRDTQGGLYSGPSEPYERFVAIQGYANRAAAVRSAEHAKVAFLNDASREQVEAFDPEADWP